MDLPTKRSLSPKPVPALTDREKENFAKFANQTRLDDENLGKAVGFFQLAKDTGTSKPFKVVREFMINERLVTESTPISKMKYQMKQFLVAC
jgi:hypothetical protein